MSRQRIGPAPDPRADPIRALATIIPLPPAGDAEEALEARLLAKLDRKESRK